jgi:hypothetical protein
MRLNPNTSNQLGCFAGGSSGQLRPEAGVDEAGDVDLKDPNIFGSAACNQLVKLRGKGGANAPRKSNATNATEPDEDVVKAIRDSHAFEVLSAETACFVKLGSRDARKPAWRVHAGEPGQRWLYFSLLSRQGEHLKCRISVDPTISIGWAR